MTKRRRGQATKQAKTRVAQKSSRQTVRTGEERSLPLFAFTVVLAAFFAESVWAIFFFHPQAPRTAIQDGPTVSVAGYYDQDAEGLNRILMSGEAIHREPLARVVAQPHGQETVITLTIEEQFVDPSLSIKGAVFAIPMDAEPVKKDGNACLPVGNYMTGTIDAGQIRQVRDVLRRDSSSGFRYIECHISPPVVYAVGTGEYNTIGVKLQFSSRTAYHSFANGYSALTMHFDDAPAYEFADSHP